MFDTTGHYEIRPAYNAETGQRDLVDEVAHCMCKVLRVDAEGFADVQILNGPEVDIHIGRLRRR